MGLEITKNKLSTILVVGGGISGISSALDLADQGFHVVMVEKDPSIGGRMAQLDKTFPTLDCSICILAPKMVEVYRHPNIDLHTYSEITEVNNEEDNTFSIKIRKKARFVDLDKCTGCGICSEKCPVKKVPSEFEAGLGKRSAIYIPFPQAVPRKATIDKINCMYLSNIEKDLCKNCEKVCPSNAIDFNQKDEIIHIKAASIIVATGFDIINPSKLERYNYDIYPNVISALQYERMLSASGPTQGHIICLDEWGKKRRRGEHLEYKEAKKIAFILCVGSRNLDICEYCSKFCCMYSTKAAIITKEHAPQTDITIFYNDLRVIGKNQDEFMVRANNEYGINFIRGIPGDVRENPLTKELIVRHADLITGEVETKEFDLVVLSSAVIPKENAKEFAKILGIKTDDYGFFSTIDSLNETESTKSGIYLAGCCQSPDDIQTCVAKASAAAASASMHARKLSKKELRKRKPEYIEKYVSPNKKARVGVFVCRCGSNIAGFVDVPQVVEELQKDKDVSFVMDNMYTCSADSQEIIKEKIQEHNLNRIIVAACTPRTHESLFQGTLEEIGLNPYLLSFVSIRELVSWVHMKDPNEAYKKALDLIKMGIRRVEKQTSLYSTIKSVTQSALVIGGGIAGITAALEIAQHGFPVDIIEKSNEIGGQLKLIDKFNFDHRDASILLTQYKTKLDSNKLIKIHTSSEIKNVSGSIGNYIVSYTNNNKLNEIDVGTIIVATGAEEFKPNGLYSYDDDKRIQTQLELANDLKYDKLNDGENIVFIQCVGSRQYEQGKKTYCSLICCGETLRHVLYIREKYPNSNIFVLYRDIRVSFKEEISYWNAREFVTYIRYIDYPKVEINENIVYVSVKDILTQANLKLKADRVVLATPLIPSETNKKLSELLKVPLDQNGFFLEAHPKLRPVDFATDGVYLCGTAHSPKGFADSIAQAKAAASRAMIPLIKGEVKSEPIIAEVLTELCIGCQVCEDVCSFGAIGVDISNGRLISQVNPMLCKGCGTCAAVCPAEAIVINHFTTEQIESMIDEALKEKNTSPKIVGFLCNWCSYAGADTAGVSRFQYSPNVRPIRVMCSGRIDPNFVLDAFLKGADGVIIGGCHLGDCHYLEGNYSAQNNFTKLLKQIKSAGIDPKRIKLEWISASEGKKFAEVMNEFIKEIKNLGPIGLTLEVQK